MCSVCPEKLLFIDITFSLLIGPVTRAVLEFNDWSIAKSRFLRIYAALDLYNFPGFVFLHFEISLT